MADSRAYEIQLVEMLRSIGRALGASGIASSSGASIRGSQSINLSDITVAVSGVSSRLDTLNQYLDVLSERVTYDQDNDAWKITGNLYATGFLTAGGVGGGGGGGGDATLADVWRSLTNNPELIPSDITNSTPINALHIPIGAGLAIDPQTGLIKVTNAGTVTSVAGVSPVNGDVPAASLVSALGLSSALKYRGVTTTDIVSDPTANPVIINGYSYSASSGDVVVLTGTSQEYMWNGSRWGALGDESSYALKTVSITGTGYLTGGGTLEQSRTIDIASNIKSIIDNAVPNTRTVNGHALSSDVTVTKGDVGLGSVENVAISTWAGSNNITTLGTITTGVWNGTAIANAYLANSAITIGSTTISLGGSSTSLAGLSKLTSSVLSLGYTLSDGTTESTLTWDSTYKAWKLEGNFYATGFITAGGVGSGGGGGGDATMADVWRSLTNNPQLVPSDITDYTPINVSHLHEFWKSLQNNDIDTSHNTDLIATAHIPDMAATYGYLKSVDLAGYLPLSAGSGKALTGDLYMGSHAITGATNIDSLLYFDTTNSRIGIGTSSPNYKLQVVSTTAYTWASRITNDNATVALAHQTGYGLAIESTSYNAGRYLIGAWYNQSSVGVGGNCAFYVKDNGAVGIGTDSPAYGLDVAGDAKISTAFYVGNVMSIIDARGFTTNWFYGRDADYGAVRIVHNDGQGSGSPGPQTATLGVIDERSAVLSGAYEPTLYVNRTGTTTIPNLVGFAISGTQYFTINSSGYTSINGGATVSGTMCDSLRVVSSAIDSMGSVVSIDFFAGGSSSVSQIKYGSSVGLLLYNSSASSNKYLIIGNDDTLKYGQYSALNTVYHSGNSNKSDVAWACSTLSASGDIVMKSNSSSSQLYGSLRFENHGTLVSVSDGSWTYSKVLSSGWNSTVYDYTDISVAGVNGRESCIRVVGRTGYVGIGTPSPLEKFHVAGKECIGLSSDSTSIGSDVYGLLIYREGTRYSAADEYYPGIAFNFTYGIINHEYNSPQAWIGTRLSSTSGSETGYLVFATKSGTQATDNPIERMCITPDGNVCIGKQSSAYKLDVNGNLNINGSISGATNIDGLLYFNTTSNYIGVGTDSPLVSLDVRGSVYLGTGNVVKIVPGRGASHFEFIGTDADYGVMRIYHTSTDGSGGAGNYTATLALIDQRNNNLGSGYEPTFFINRSGATRTPDLMGVNVGGTRYFTIDSSGNVSAYGTIFSTTGIYSDGYVTAGSASDARLKDNVRTMEFGDAMTILSNVRPVRFSWNGLANSLCEKYVGNDMGMIAQEVEPYIPEAISSIYGEYKRLDYTKFIAPLVCVAKSHEERLQQAEKRIAVLGAENAQLKARLNA